MDWTNGTGFVDPDVSSGLAETRLGFSHSGMDRDEQETFYFYSNKPYHSHMWISEMLFSGLCERTPFPLETLPKWYPEWVLVLFTNNCCLSQGLAGNRWLTQVGQFEGHLLKGTLYRGVDRRPKAWGALGDGERWDNGPTWQESWLLGKGTAGLKWPCRRE